jgi:predicted XRE-type DNA-binding protein
MKRDNNQIEFSTSDKEGEIFRWVESDECLGNWIPSEEATILEKTKYQFCQSITQYALKNNLSEEEVAERLRLNKSTATKLLRGWTEAFALDSLISYVEKLHLPVEVKVNWEEKRQLNL